MINEIGVAAMLEQLAEESAEVTHAALKCARIFRGENPTPADLATAVTNLKEEYTDLVQCVEELGIKPDREQMHRKEARFKERWNRYVKKKTGSEREGYRPDERSESFR